MKALIRIFAVSIFLIVSHQASAVTYQWYQIHGNTCTSISQGLTPTYNQYGVNAPGASAIAVTCPVILPSQNYVYAYIQVVGYNRNSVNKLSCTINGARYDGANYIWATATLPNNLASYQIATNSISPTVAASNNNLSVTCYLPAATASGLSHLTEIFLYVGY